jgi:sec-independent protein translocase protein TatC
MAGFRVKRLNHDEEVTVVEHLDELRNRLFVSLICLGIVFVVAFWRHEDLIQLILDKLPYGPNGKQYEVQVTQPGEQFSIAIQVSFWASVCVALPVLFYQLYAYVMPAFNPDRQKTTWPLLFLCPTLFIAGALFSYAVVVPAAGGFLLNFDEHLYLVQPKASAWYEWVVTLMLAVGLIFEIPAAIFVLTKMGVVDHHFLRKNRKYAILINTVIAAALPGVDPVSMIMEAIPLFALYEISILISWLVGRKRDPIDEPLAEA